MNAMLKNILKRIENDLSNGRSKIIFGALSNQRRKELLSYVMNLVSGEFSSVEFFEGDLINSFKRLDIKNGIDKWYCVLVDDLFVREDFAVLINKVFGKRNVVMIGTSSHDINAIDPSKITTIAGRFDSYYLADHSFSDLPSGIDFVTYLSKGGRIFGDNNQLYTERVLERIKMENAMRKPDTFSAFFDYSIRQAGKNMSEREMSLGFDSRLSPNTIGKFLDVFTTNFLLYKLKGFDFSKMRKIQRNFRLYPYDTSLYSYNRKESAMNINLLTMTLLIGRAKEEGYDCYYGYFHRQKMMADGKRKYCDDNVGLYVTDGKRQMVFSLNIGQEESVSNNMNIVSVSSMVEKYIVESGKSSGYYDNKGVCHIGVEYLLGDGFDWEGH